MNNKKNVTICSIIALVILVIVIIITLAYKLTGFSIILSSLFVILTICLGIYLKEEPDEYSQFIKNKKRILKTYDSIIVEVEDIPNIAGKNIIKVKSIEDLVDAQQELREPIYYKNDNDSCFFLLLHYNEACIYILRMNESVISPTEQSIRFMKEDKKDANKKSDNVLENVENTIIYKLDELRSFKISPIRNENKIEVVDDTAIKAEIDAENVTSTDLKEEMSKTMYLKNLKEKIKKYEEENGETKENNLRSEIPVKVKEQSKKENKVEKKSVSTKERPKIKKDANKKDGHARRRTTTYNQNKKK